MRIALGLEYLGTAFTGWQSQPDGRAVQDALERALGTIAGTPVRVIAAGRTDRGVHATLQVAHFDTQAERPATAWVRGVNAHLEGGIAVLWAQAARPDFHARFCASGRHYTYLLLTRAVRPALVAGRVGWYHRSLDVPAMHRAAQRLIGTHDFSAFRAAECQARSPVKHLTHASVAAEGNYVRFEFSASAFLHHMVRNLVGSLVAVGAAKHDDAWLADLLASRDRTRAAATFAAEGLYLTGVDYPSLYGLPPCRRALDVPLPR